MAERKTTPYLLSAPALLVYSAFLAAPLIAVTILSFNTFTMATGIQPGFSLANYAEVLTDDYFHRIFLRTFGLALLVAAIAALIGTPEAYILHRMAPAWRSAFLLVILGPLLVSVLVRTLGWAVLLGRNGLINSALIGIGAIERPIEFMYTMTGVVVALVHVLVPFHVLAVWASLRRLDPAVEAAGLSLGASQATVLRRIVVPQIMPGILSGSLIVFTLAASAFATPSIIGGRRLKVVAMTAYDEFLNSQNWPMGAAIAAVLLAATLVIVLGYNRWVERRYAQAFQ
ncbi:MAG: ABC transporter permease [Alphaproteobacteria bacterium]|nr:ABC transporter permease [Alphaproteobacteria bacterium]MBM3733890.1 ABC transporter permease [Acidimicrobiia bacterium]